MAKEKEEIKGLVAIAKKMAELREGTNMPSGKKDDVAENQVTELDMIAGICSAALFGSANRNKDNYQNLLSNPNKSSYLGQIYTLLNVLSKQFKPIISDKALQVKSTLIGMSPEMIKYFVPTENSSESALGQIIIDINGINNVDDLNRVLVELAENTNNVGLLDGLTGIFNVISKINELTSVDTSAVVTNVKNINDLATELENIGGIKIIDPDKLNQIIVASDDLNRIISSINNLPKDVIESNIFTQDDKLQNALDGISKTVEIINKISIPRNFESTTEQLNKLLTGKLVDDLHIFLEKVQDIVNGTGINSNPINLQGQVQGLGELIQGIINIGNFNGKIDTKAIKELTKLVAKNGSISTIIQNINNLGLKAIDKSSIEALEHVKNYFDVVSSISELSLLDKLRIMMNIAFFKYYVNNSLPNLIADIDKNFKGINLEDKDGTLNNLSKYFYALKNIASLSFKDQISLYTSINVLRGLIIEDLGDLINDINTKFKDITINENITQVFDLFDQIKDLTINSTFDEQRKALHGLHKFLFGSSPTGGKTGGKIGRGLDFLKEQSSVLAIVNRLNSESSSFASIKKPLNQLKSVFESLDEVIANFKIDNKDVKEIQLALDSFNNGVLINLIKIGEDNQDKKYVIGITTIKDFTKEINKSFKTVKLDETIKKIIIGKDTYKQFKETIKLFKELPNLFKALEIASKTKLTKKAFKKITEIVDNLAVVVNKFAAIDPEKINAAIKMLNEITKFMIISAGILIIGTLIMGQFSFGDMFTFIVGISTMVGLFWGVFAILSKFDPKDVENKIKLMHNISLLMMTLGATVAICTSIMKNVDWPQLWMFLVGMGALLAASVVIIGILTKIKGDIKESLPIAKDLALLIIACGLSIGLASFIGQNASPRSILAFGGAIMLLIASIMIPMRFFKGVKSIMFDGVADLGKLVLYCGLTLALAGLVTEYLDIGSLFKFTLMLGLLVSGIMLAVGAFGKKEIQGAKDLGTMVLYCSAALLLGGMLFTLWPELKNGVKDFAITLVLFTGAILLVAGLAALMGGEALQHIKSLNTIVAWSAATLLIGGLLFMLLGKPFEDAVKKFTLTLFLFVFGIGLTVALVGAFVSKETLGKMWMLALLVGVSALAITLGPILLSEYNVPYSSVWQFLAISLLFTGGMAFIIWSLSEIDVMDLVKGILAMTAIEFLIYGMGICIGKIADTIKKMDEIGYKKIWEGMMHIGLIFGAVGLVVAGLGALMSTGIGAIIFAAGAAALASLEAVIWGMAKCILMVVKAVKASESIKNVNVKEAMKPILGFITESKSILTEFGVKDILKIKAVTKALSGMGNMIANIASGVQKYAELKVPEAWDPQTGKPTGFRQLKNTDFTNAARNIGTIIATLGQTILWIYQGEIFDPISKSHSPIMDKNDAKDMFSGSWVSSSKFSKVVKSLSKLGGMISSIAKGVQNYANLTIPTDWNSDGDPIKFKKMTNKDFTDASETIAKVISTLGMSIVAIYNGKQWDPSTGKLTSIPNFTEEMAHDMFSGNWFSKSPFRRVIDSTSKLGNVISSLSKGIQNYANLTIPVDWDKNTGAPIKFERMDEKKFKAAGEAIGKVITTLGLAITTVANSGDFKTYYDLHKMKSIIDAIGKVSNFIGPLSNTITKYALGKFPLLEYKDGKLSTNYEGGIDISNYKGGWKGLQNDLNESISHVLLGLGIALNNVMKSDDITILTKSNGKVTNFLKNIKSLSETLKSIFGNIGKISALNITKDMVENTRKAFKKYIEIAQLLDTFTFDKEKYDEFHNLNSSVEIWIATIGQVDLENTENKTNVLANSITTLFSTIADLQQNSGFADHVDTVKRYVEAINAVDIDKIESMTNLAFAVTNLGDKIGNIDKFTDTLAKKIALTLNALTKQIKDASVIIKDADTLHKKRETSIKNSIGKITDLMNKSMVVEIKNDQPTTTLTGGTGGFEGGGGTDTTGTTPGGGSDTTLVQTPPSSNDSSSGRSGGSSVEIDYDKLAKAIARAFKQI